MLPQHLPFNALTDILQNRSGPVLYYRLNQYSSVFEQHVMPKAIQFGRQVNMLHFTV